MNIYNLTKVALYLMVIGTVVAVFSCMTATKTCAPYSKVENATCATYRSGKVTKVDCRVLLENGERKDLGAEVLVKGDIVNRCVTEFVLPFGDSISYEREE